MQWQEPTVADECKSESDSKIFLDPPGKTRIRIYRLASFGFERATQFILLRECFAYRLHPDLEHADEILITNASDLPTQHLPTMVSVPQKYQCFDSPLLLFIYVIRHMPPTQSQT
jgi:hypothetical protein